MTRVQEIKREIKETNTLLENLWYKLTNAYKETFLTCKKCGERSKIKNCVLINYQWYDENTGSPCGGFYQHGGYHIGCPKCKHFWNNKIEDEQAYEMAEAFKTEIKEYDNNNNQYYTLEEE